MLLAVLLTASTALSNATGLTPAQIQEISAVAAAAVETEHLPGLSVAVLKDGCSVICPAFATTMARTASRAKAMQNAWRWKR